MKLSYMDITVFFAPTPWTDPINYYNVCAELGDQTPCHIFYLYVFIDYINQQNTITIKRYKKKNIISKT